MSTPTETPKRGVPLGRLIVVLGTLGVLGIVYLGARNLVSGVTLKTVPLAGEWQAAGKPWRLVFRPDKTLTSSTAPAQGRASPEWPTGPGSYSVDYFGTLWVKLNNGNVYRAALSDAVPNRFDLIESSTEIPTVFERVGQAKPAPQEPAKEPSGKSGP